MVADDGAAGTMKLSMDIDVICGRVRQARRQEDESPLCPHVNKRCRAYRC